MLRYRPMALAHGPRRRCRPPLWRPVTRRPWSAFRPRLLTRSMATTTAMVLSRFNGTHLLPLAASRALDGDDNDDGLNFLPLLCNLRGSSLTSMVMQMCPFPPSAGDGSNGTHLLPPAASRALVVAPMAVIISMLMQMWQVLSTPSRLAPTACSHGSALAVLLTSLLLNGWRLACLSPPAALVCRKAMSQRAPRGGCLQLCWWWALHCVASSVFDAPRFGVQHWPSLDHNNVVDGVNIDVNEDVSSP